MYVILQPAAVPAAVLDKSQVNPLEVTHKLEALQIQNGDVHHLNDKVTIYLQYYCALRTAALCSRVSQTLELDIDWSIGQRIVPT